MVGEIHPFVGRGREIDIFEEILSAPYGEQHLLLIWGPGGIGKTVLVKELLKRASERNNLLVS